MALLFSGVLFSQSITSSWQDPCTGETKVFTVPLNGSATVVTIYNQSRVVTAQDVTSGALTAWAASAYQAYQALSPCSQSETQQQATSQAVQQTAQEAAKAATTAATSQPVQTTSVPAQTTSTPPAQTQTTNPTTSQPQSNQSGTTNTTSNGNNQTTTSGNDSQSSNQTSSSSSNSSGNGESGNDNTQGDSTNSQSSGQDDQSSGTDQGNETSNSETTEPAQEDSSTSSEGTEDTTSTESDNTESETTENSSSEESSDSSSEASEDAESEAGAGEDSEGEGGDSDESSNDEQESEEVKEEDKKEEESSEKESEEESEEETTEEESTEEEKEEEKKDEKKKKKKRQKNTNPPIIVANITSMESLDGRFSSAMTLGVSRSSMRGDKTYALNSMIWANGQQFMLMVNYSKVFMKDNRPTFVYSTGLMGSKMFTTLTAGNNHSLVYLGKKGGVYGFSLAATTIYLNYELREASVLIDQGILSGSVTAFFTKPYNFDKISASPMLAVSAPFLNYDMFNDVTTINKDLTIITGVSGNYALTQRFVFNLGVNVIHNTNKDLRSLFSFTIGSRFQF